MRILFDQAEHAMRNKGNNALLQAATDRLGGYWPSASLDVVTIAPNLARLNFPNLNPVSPDDLCPAQSRVDRFQRYVPRAAWRVLFEVREEIWHRRAARMSATPRDPGLSEQANDGSSTSDFEAKAYPHPEMESAQGGKDTQALIDAVSGYDLVVATGGGYLCDHDSSLPGLLDRLEAAIARGVPTVMVGQGVGPMEDRELRARAKEVLPNVDLICYRNRRLGQPLLESLGVPAERMMMTGDDAVEMAYQARGSSLGTGIGVSLRVSSYTQVGKRHIEIVRSVLHRAASERKAQLIAVPISSAHHESDITHIKQLLAGYSNASAAWQKLDTPLDAITKVGRCRLMVAGTYHGAIFALAQGIPLIGVAKSLEYYNKLSELTDEFGPGCQVLRLDDDRLPDKLTAAIDAAWASAEEVRPALLEAAARQIEWQHAAYQRIYNLVTSRVKEREVVSDPTTVALSIS
jgi:polysaccharide pyruvyl transferase WcaK-like protein